MSLLSGIVVRVSQYRPRIYRVLRIPPVRKCSSNGNLVMDIDSGPVCRYFEEIQAEYWGLRSRHSHTRGTGNRLREISPLVQLIEERNTVLSNLKNLEELCKEQEKNKDQDMAALVKEERKVYEGVLKEVNERIVESMFDGDVHYSASDTIVEVSAGVGGQEAMLFARELFDMYLGFANYKRWTTDITQLDSTEIGGVKKGSVVFSGPGTFELLRTEGGVHRVQRVPTTEKAGRLHTSTVTVAILLQPTEIELNIPERDIKIETKRATGAGGQHVNTTDSAVRVVHLPTGMSVECQTERNQIQNKRNALERLRALLYEQQLEKQEMEEKSSRKSQVGLGQRNEKIRTYNYQQDRVTDHRIGASGGTIHGVKSFLNGGENLDKLICKLRRYIKTQEVLEKIELYKKDSHSAVGNS